MSHVGRVVSRGMVLIGAVLLSSCATVTPVQEITADRAGYMTKNFAPASLSPDIAKMLPKKPSAGNFGTLKLTINTSVESSDGKKEAFKNHTTLIDVGNGLVQRLSEHSGNDIPYFLTFNLSFRNFISLRRQNVFLNRRLSMAIIEAKNATRLDDVPSSLGSEFAFEYTYGTQVQIANFTSASLSCKVTGEAAASEVHPKLVGRILELACEERENNVLQVKARMVYLQHYGFAILKEMAENSRVTKLSVTEVN